METAATEINDEFRWNLLQKNILERNAVRAFALFREARIEPLLIKGLAAGKYYPYDRPRVSVDLDLAVSDTNFFKAEEIARSEAAQDLAIDLHRELRHLDTVPWDSLFSSSVMMPLRDAEIRIPRPEDHLRIVCLHWLTDGGRVKDRLYDVYYAVTHRDATFDWDRFFTIVSPTRQRWLECTLGLTAKYLGLDISGTPADGAENRLPRWLTETVEREWSAEIKFEPMEVAVFDRKKFLHQLGRRLNPNPIWATVQAEGSFDAPTRLHFKIANAFRRIPDSYRRITEALTLRSRG
ncbi:MAG: nucleotidyltransferase family protein [Acidobacteria bacterium]|nr:nucleotidyltransferase family protein [Acidobacteriota bacterium]